MPESPSSDVSFSAGTVEVTSGLYDTDDGVKLRVAGDAFPRVHLTPQGVVKTGNGTEAPANLAAAPEQVTAVYNAGASVWVATIPSTTGNRYELQPITDTNPITLVFRVPSLTAPASFSVVSLAPAAAGSVTAIALSDGEGGGGATVGGGFNVNTTISGFYADFQNAGGGWAVVVQSQVTGAYSPANSGVWATSDPNDVRTALNRIAAVVGGITPIPA